MTGKLTWFKSSYSSGEGGECLEVAYAWRKSSYSDGEGGECVEVTQGVTDIHVRDSKNPTGGVVTLAPAAWSAFLAGELGYGWNDATTLTS
ncbi:DUF397 domain-containing protein [Streptomyces sp. FZ201]|uniref:DUF397 domain-containing protein n=1 Tax=Streptomyces sp. FZ201 TaxID=3057122 RepID=UPI0021C0FBCC|nr:DUF397 domain-containing protein [Streptomyces sp. FZ201]